MVCVKTGKGNREIVTLLVHGGGKVSLNHPEWSLQNKGASPLHTAARLGRVDNAEVLLRLGADVNIIDSSGQTPLHVAAVHEITGQSLPHLFCSHRITNENSIYVFNFGHNFTGDIRWLSTFSTFKRHLHTYLFMTAPVRLPRPSSPIYCVMF